MTRGCTSCSPAAAPRRRRCASRLGDTATFLGWLSGDDLARAYASADVFLFASRTDTFGQVILEAQASGLPVVAVGEGGPASLIDARRDRAAGARPTPDALADCAAERDRKPAAGRRAAPRTARSRSVRGRTWEAALERLAAGYRRTLAAGAGCSSAVA